MTFSRASGSAIPDAARRVYLDHNATTPVRPEALEAMLPFLQGCFGNPSSPHTMGQEARAAVEKARAQVAGLAGARPEEIVFTSCGSEAGALAVIGAAQRAFDLSSGRRRHVVASAIEHAAVREALGVLRARGFETTELPVDSTGKVSVDAVREAIGPSTVLVSVMHANNEVGTIEPIREIAEACRERGVLFHTDAVQSAGKIPVDASGWGIDLLSLSGHKLGAPKGVGALFVARGVRLTPLICGHQEKSRRGGTENVASIAAFGAACERAAAELEEASRGLLSLRRRLEQGCLAVGGCRVNGHPTDRLPGTCHVSFDGLDGFQLLVALDLEGICVSSGPACSAGAAEPSHVLRAMGVEPGPAAGSLRISLGRGSTEAEVARFLEVLPGAVGRLRKVGVAA